MREALREVARGLKEAKIGLREGHNGGVTYHGDITDYTHVRYNYNIGDAKKEVRKEFQKDAKKSEGWPAYFSPALVKKYINKKMSFFAEFKNNIHKAIALGLSRT